MKRIVTNLEKLEKPAAPIKFLGEKGIEAEESAKCKEIVEEIKARMEHDNLLALSAPQIGIDARVICIKFNDGIKTFIDPIVNKKNGMTIALETCASMPGKEIVISRPTEIFIKYYDENLKYEDNKLVGAAAGLFDQQAHILDGILPNAIGMISDIEADGKITDEDLPELSKFYKETFVPAKLAAIQKQVDEADEETKKEYNKLKFTEGVINGNIAVIQDEKETEMVSAAKDAANKSVQMLNKSKMAMQKAEYRANVLKHSRKRGR